MEMSCVRRARSRDRRRRICASSRSAQTPRHLILDLDADGAGYLVRTDAGGSHLVQPWPEMHLILAHATDKPTPQATPQRRPVEADAPDPPTPSRGLKRATHQGVVRCSASGYRGDPLLYWLPGREGLPWPGDSAGAEERQPLRDRCAGQPRSVRQRMTSA
jgi:hypothetical protein